MVSLKELTCFFCISLVVSVVWSQCSFYDESTNCNYDLSNLIIQVGNPDYFFNDTAKSTYYYINICAALSQSHGCTPDSAVCQIQAGASKSCGLIGDISLQPYGGSPITEQCDGVTVYYDGGDYCSGARRDRQSYLDIGCNPALPTSPQLSATVIDKVTETTACIYRFQMYSSLTCGTNAGTSPCASPVANTPTPSTTKSTFQIPSKSPSRTPTKSSVTIESDSPSKSISLSSTSTASQTPTPTSSSTPTSTSTTSATPTPTPTISATPTRTPSITPSRSESSSRTPSISVTPSISESTPPDLVEWYWWTLTAFCFLSLGLILGVIAAIMLVRAFLRKKTQFDDLGYE